jgi:hypothetical protein
MRRQPYLLDEETKRKLAHLCLPPIPSAGISSDAVPPATLLSNAPPAEPSVITTKVAQLEATPSAASPVSPLVELRLTTLEELAAKRRVTFLTRAAESLRIKAQLVDATRLCSESAQFALSSLSVQDDDELTIEFRNLWTEYTRIHHVATNDMEYARQELDELVARQSTT